jgi:RHS repeat-associated protein
MKTADLTNGSGGVVGSYAYDVFGGTVSGPAGNEWRFTGEQRDADSGLYYLRARYYDPATGRFLGRDPIMAAEPYAYVGNNPVNWVDPRGLASEGGPIAAPIPAPSLPVNPGPTPTPTPTPCPGTPVPVPAPTPIAPPGYVPPTHTGGVSLSCLLDCICDFGLGVDFLDGFVCGVAGELTAGCAYFACRTCNPLIPITCTACYGCLSPFGGRAVTCVARCAG